MFAIISYRRCAENVRNRLPNRKPFLIYFPDTYLVRFFVRHKVVVSNIGQPSGTLVAGTVIYGTYWYTSVPIVGRSMSPQVVVIHFSKFATLIFLYNNLNNFISLIHYSQIMETQYYLRPVLLAQCL